MTARTTSAGSGAPTPGGVAADEVGLELVELVGRDPDVGELAEAGIDPVDRLPRRDRARSTSRRLAHQLGAGGRIEGHANARRPGDADHVVDR